MADLHTAALKDSMLSLCPTQASASPSSPSSFSTTSSSARRVCRICQSETGLMVRPCGCAGTMGDIHEKCLSTWVNHSNKQICEVCNLPYAKTGKRLKPFREWTKPQPDFSDFMDWMMFGVLIGCTGYMIWLLDERLVFERLYKKYIPMRIDDAGRFFILISIVLSLMASLFGLVKKVNNYISSQTHVSFTNRSVE